MEKGRHSKVGEKEKDEQLREDGTTLTGKRTRQKSSQGRVGMKINVIG